MISKLPETHMDRINSLRKLVQVFLVINDYPKLFFNNNVYISQCIMSMQFRNFEVIVHTATNNVTTVNFYKRPHK